jgi:hypothetical protein
MAGEILVNASEWNRLTIVDTARRDAATFGRIQRLDLSQCTQTNDEFILDLAPLLPKLRTVSLYGCVQLTDAAVFTLAAHCPKLRDLTLTNCPNLTDAAVLRLGERLTFLERLDLTHCPLVTAASVRVVVANNPQLLHLTPGFLRAIPQAEELDPARDLRKQLDARATDYHSL